MGFYYSIMVVGALPLILQIALNDTHGSDRDSIESDITDNLYSRLVYIVTSVSYIYLHILKVYFQLKVFFIFIRFYAVFLHLF